MENTTIPNDEIQLTDYHRRLLEDHIGINANFIDVRAYRTIVNSKVLKTSRVSSYSCLRPGVPIPLYSTLIETNAISEIEGGNG